MVRIYAKSLYTNLPEKIKNGLYFPRRGNFISLNFFIYFRVFICVFVFCCGEKLIIFIYGDVVPPPLFAEKITFGQNAVF